ncbi:MAG: aminotransferase class III-fold pyridoxal phosphate-dependent enzyme, partial [Puniceicoccaceae bacterium]
GMAKGLGGGFPIGAIWAAGEAAELFTPGSHGTTFGGTPLACAAALAVLDTIEREDLLGAVKRLAPAWHGQLRELAASFPALVREVRARGFMIGLGLAVDPAPVVAALREAGLLVPAAGGNTIRLLPPLTATADELTAAVGRLRSVFASTSAA